MKKAFFVRLISILFSTVLLIGCTSPPTINTILRTRALDGDVQAQYEIGEVYYEARYSFFGKAAYWEDAAKWFEMAANQGDAKAHYRLASYYFSHVGDYNQSFKWLRLPAQKGIAEAQHFLGMHYAQAWGTTPSLVLAYMWITLSFEGGVPDPIGKLADLEWLIKRGKMSPKQINEGQLLAAEHTKKYGKSRPINMFN